MDDLFTPDPGSEVGTTAVGVGGGGGDDLFEPDTGDSLTPETDKAIKDSGSLWTRIIAAAKTPSPAAFQPAENVIRDVATFQIPGVAQANPIYWAGKYNQAMAPLVTSTLGKPAGAATEFVGDLGVGLSKGVASMATPMNIGLAVAAPPTALGKAAISGIFTGQAIAHTPEMVEQIKKDYAAGDTSALTEHAAELAGSYLPAAHFIPGLGGKGKSAEAKAAQPGPRTAQQNQALTELWERVKRGEMTGNEYAAEARKVASTPGTFQTGEQGFTMPVVEHNGVTYTYDEGSNRWMSESGNPVEKPDTVDAITSKWEKQQNEITAPEPKKEETDTEAEARARALAKRYTNLAGDPEAVFKDMTDVTGQEPTWVEFADELQGEISKLTATPELAKRHYHEGIARRRGMTPEELTEELDEKEFQRRLRLLDDQRNAELSRKEMAEEAKQTKKGRYAKRSSDEEIQGGYTALGVKERPSGAQQPTGSGYNVVGKTEGEGARGNVPGEESQPASGRLVPTAPVSLPPEINHEFYNRAKHNVSVRLGLPENPVELVKLQDEGIAPEPLEIHRLTISEYEKLLAHESNRLKREKAAKVKPTVAAPKAPQGDLAETEPPKFHPLSPGVRPGSQPAHFHPTESGKPGLRATILNARDMGLTVEEYRKWRQGLAPDWPSDADSIAQRQKERGIKSETERPVKSGEFKQKGYTAVPTEKTFRVKTAVDDFAASAENPVSSAVSEMGGLLSKTSAQKAGVYEGNKALWDDAPGLKHPSHNKIYKSGGERPDIMAQTLFDAGLIKEPSVDAMYRALEKESKSTRTRAKEKPEEGTQVKQAEDFGKAQREEQETGSRPIAAQALSVGDVVEVDGAKLRVTDVDPDSVTLEDGKRFGIQEVANDDIIYGEVKTAPGKNVFGEPQLPPEQPLAGKGGGIHSVNLEQKNPLGLEAAAREPGGKILKAGSLFHKDLQGVSDKAELGFIDKSGEFLTREKALQETNKAQGGLGKFSTKTNFKKTGDSRYEHKNTKLIINKGKEGGWDARHPNTGETIGNYPSRQAAMEAHADGGVVPIAKQGARLRLKANNEGGFVNAEILKEAAGFGKRLFARGYDYAKWAKEMVKHLGQKIAGHLKDIWENLTGGKFRPGFKESGEVGRMGKMGYGREKNLPGWAKEEMQRRGLDPNRPLNDVDVSNPSVREAIKNDPSLSEQQKTNILKTGSPERRMGFGRGESMSAVRSAANARLQINPRHADMVISDLASGKKTKLDTVDQHVLVQHRALLQGTRDTAAMRMKSDQLSPGDRAEASRIFEDADSQIRTMDEAMRQGTVLTNQTQRSLWHTFRAKDYSLESIRDKIFSAKNGKPLTPEETAKAENLTEKLASLTAQIAAKERMTGWSPGVGKPAPSGLRQMQYEAFRAKVKLDNMVFKAKLKQAPIASQIWQTGRQVLAIPRALMASMDLSAVRRQGGILFLSHPIRSLRIFPDMLRAAKSEKAYFELMQELRERPNAELYKSSKLGMTDINTPRLSEMEEQYMSEWAAHIPAVAHSQRAYVYYLNRLRADSFDAMAKTLTAKGEVTEAQAKVISNLINVFTGRGDIAGKYSTAMVAANDLFFAPRYILSRFQALTGQPLRMALKSGEARSLIAKEYARALIGYGIVYGLVGTTLKQFATVEKDPRSTDFGKIKIGDTRIDIMSGLSQPTVLMSRLATRSTKQQSGKIEPLFAGGGARSRRLVGDVVTDFFRSKLAPVPAALWNAAEGKKVTGERTQLLPKGDVGTSEFQPGELLNMVTPLSGGDIYAALRDFGVPKGAAYSLLAFFGDSVNTYSPRAHSTQRKRHWSR